MKKCPFCAEEIQDDAKKCRFCGEFLKEEAEEERKPEVIPVARPTKESPDRNAFTLFFLLSLPLSIVVWSLQSAVDISFPFVTLTMAILGIVGLIIGIKILRNKKLLALRIMGLSIPFIIVGGIFFI